MIDRGKKPVLGVGIDVVDYEGAVTRILAAARARRPLAVSALAVHGVMTGLLDPSHRYRLNRLGLVTADGQPVRWALNLLHGTNLADRVCGPDLMLKTCEVAAAEGLPVYFYGSSPPVLAALEANLRGRLPGLVVAGRSPSRFGRVDDATNAAILADIRASGARLVFVGLGCPRQEVFAFENAEALSCPVLAVGAAFDFHAGLLQRAPAWMQARGLEWLYRFTREPRRLWHRYMVLNPLFCWNLALQWLRPGRFAPERDPAPAGRQNFA